MQNGRDPDAPHLILFHDDGTDESAISPVARAIWPGASVASLRGAHREGAGWRHLEALADDVADLAAEESGVARLAGRVWRAVAREPSLIVTVAVGEGGGADAVLGLLCQGCRGLSAAILREPRRTWSPGSLASVRSGLGVEVLLSPHPERLLQALQAKLMLKQAGHLVEVRRSDGTQDYTAEHVWLRRQLCGERSDDE